MDVLVNLPSLIWIHMLALHKPPTIQCTNFYVQAAATEHVAQEFSNLEVIPKPNGITCTEQDQSSFL